MQYATLYLLFFLSGVAGLGYEILWTRMLAVGLGHEIVSMLAVVGAFFAGIALGGWFLDRPVSRSSQPVKWFILFELIIGVWGVALLLVLPELNPKVGQLLGVDPAPVYHWLTVFFYPFFVLLPATFVMGGTLSAMDRCLGQIFNTHRSVAGVYSSNTFGAMAGALLVTFLLLPSFGIKGATFFLAAINAAVAGGLMVLARGKASGEQSYPHEYTPQKTERGLYFILFFTGLLGIGYEVLIVRVLSQVLENTVFSFASILVTFLFGTALGAAIYQRVARRNTEQMLSLLLATTAFFCLLSIYLLGYIEPLYSRLEEVFGNSFHGAVIAEISLCLSIFLLPTCSMGAAFSHLAQSVKRTDRGVGRALCLNTMGGAIAPLLFAVLLLPHIGLQYALLVIPLGYLLCCLRFQLNYLIPLFVIIGLIGRISQDPSAYRFVSLDEGDTVVEHREGVMATVTVVEDRHHEFHLKVNNHFQMGGTTSVFSDRRQAYLPLLLHPKPRQALFLGLGTGATFAAAATFPDLQAVGVELLPEVIEVKDHFKQATRDFGSYEKLTIVNADARRYVMASDQSYDVIVADLFHPARDGAGSLYTLEHFQAVHDVLSDDGLFCQWLPLYQIDIETFKVIARTFLQIFPEGQAFLAHYSIDQPIIGLIGGRQALRFPEKWYRKRTGNKNFRRHLAGFGYDSIYSLLGTFMAGSDVLGQFVHDSPLNTDNNPVVLFRAPRFVYEKWEPAEARLLKLLLAFSPPNPEAILSEEVSEEDHIARLRLPAYWSARDSFLRLGTLVEKTDNVQQLYAAAGDSLLEVVRQSVDFSAAYFPLISIAYELYPHDSGASYKLLQDLERANPMRSEAAVLRRRLFADSAAH